MNLRTPLILLLTLVALLLAAPASASAAASVKRFPSGARVGSVSATAERTSKTVAVRVNLSLRAPKGHWRAGVLVSLVCGERSLSGSFKVVTFTGRTGRTRRITTTIKVPSGTCKVRRRVVVSVLVSRSAAGAATWARGQTAFRTR
ncbi:MAG: hypothetical protein QOE98_560 [Gaiellaceae bacterium]|nr:hypothetical protein [Gaiellaceae bacterium]